VECSLERFSLLMGMVLEAFEGFGKFLYLCCMCIVKFGLELLRAFEIVGILQLKIIGKCDRRFPKIDAACFIYPQC
jgi:hypothetical protein